jgi:HK97 family phage major capsid protein
METRGGEENDVTKLKILIATLAGLMAVEAAQRDEKKVADVIKGLSEWLDSDEAKQDNEAMVALRAEVTQIRKDLDDAHNQLRKAHSAMLNRAIAVPDAALITGPIRRRCFQFSNRDLALKFGQFALDVRAIKSGRSPRWFKDLSPNADETGGFAIPDAQMSGEISMMVERVGVMAQLAQNVPMGPGGFKQVRGLTGVTMAWKTAGAAGTESSPTFGMIELHPETLFGYVDVDIEMDEDAIVQLGNWLATQFIYGIGDEEDRVMISGTGMATDGGITGILNSDRVTVYTPTVDHDEFAEIDWADLAAVEGECLEDALTNAVWLMHRTIKALMKALVDTNGHPIWQPPSAGEPAELGGYPLVTASRMVTTASDGASTKMLAFGDFNRGLYLGRRGDIRVDYSDHVQFKTGQRVWRAMERLDAAVNGYTSTEITDNSKLANPIVVLSTHS